MLPTPDIGLISLSASMLKLKSGCDQYLQACSPRCQKAACVCVCMCAVSASTQDFIKQPPHLFFFPCTHTHTHRSTPGSNRCSPPTRSSGSQIHAFFLPLHAIPTRMLNTIQMSARRIDWNNNSERKGRWLVDAKQVYDGVDIVHCHKIAM